VLAGIDTDKEATGYKKIIIKPYVDGKIVNTADNNNEWSKLPGLNSGIQHGKSLSSVAADLQTYYGKISSHWKIEDGKLSLAVEIPANTTAVIYLPTGKPEAIKESGASISNSQGSIIIKEKKPDYTSVAIGSGKYQFSIE
jgi:alpha-L-rhamnosidase